MKKSVFLLTLILFIVSANISLLSQEIHSLDRPNEIYGGYGAGSVYYFASPIDHYYADIPYYSYSTEQEPTSIGTFFLGYNRHMGKVVSIGFVVSYMHLNQNIEYNNDPYSYDTTTFWGQNQDDLITGMARVTFNYVRKPVLTIYSGAALGMTIDLGSSTVNGFKDTERKLKPAGQLTLFGLRAGKALGGFIEFGVGTNGILIAGISYKIKD
jgi:hypothetical protein